MTHPSERALLESALAAIEQVLARHHIQPDGAAPLTPAQEAMSICLASAAALVEVSHTLLRSEHGDSADRLVQEWQALIGHTKAAGRTAHQAVLVLASQANIVAAQHGVRVTGDSTAGQETA